MRITLQKAQTTVAAAVEEIRSRAANGMKCTANPCYDPLCPFHAAEGLEGLRSPEWAPAPGSEPWQSLLEGTLALGSVLDHTLLRPETTSRDIEAGCREALELQCAAFCANLTHVPLMARLLAGSPVRVCTVVGFPLGASPTVLKVQEARWAVEQGAHEIDMVISIGMLRGRDFHLVMKDIDEVVRATHEGGALCKVILETALLQVQEKIAVCILASRAGADFVKTSTGYSKSGATAEDVALMRLVVGDSLGVKAAGGIRTRDQALALLHSGASRIGTSSSPTIVRGQPAQEDT